MTELEEGNAHPDPGAKHGDVPRHPEMQLLRLKVNLHLRPAFEIDGGSFDVASRQADVQNGACNEQPAVRQRYYRAAFACEARLLPPLFSVRNRRRRLSLWRGRLRQRPLCRFFTQAT